MKKIISLMLLIIAFVTFNVCLRYVEAYQTKDITNPEELSTFSYQVYIADSSQPEIISAADKAQINFTYASMNYNGTDTIFEMYWHIIDSKFLSNIDVLNNEISLDQFNKLDYAISNYKNDKKYYFNIISNNNTYYSLKSYSQLESNKANYLTIFSDSEESINSFISYIESGGGKVEKGYENYNISNISLMIKSIYQVPEILLALSMLFLLLFIIIYNDKRTISIYLINGSSKFRYALNTSEKLIKKMLIISVIAYSIMTIKTLLYNRIPLLVLFKNLLLWTGFYILVITLIPTLISYLFTDVNVTSYKLGRKVNRFSGTIVGIYKIILSILLIVTLANSLNSFIYSYNQNLVTDITIEDSKDMYFLTVDNNENFINNEKAIIESIYEHDDLIYTRYKINERQTENVTLKDRVVLANSNYIKNLNINGIIPESNIYFSRKLFEDHNGDIDYICSNTQVCPEDRSDYTILDIDLKLITTSINAEMITLMDDYIIVLENNPSLMNIRDVFIKSKEGVRPNLHELNIDEDLVNVELLNKILYTNKSIIKDTMGVYLKWILTYIAIMVAYTLLNYQILFDRYKKKNSILYVSGKYPYTELITEFIFQTIVITLIIIISKRNMSMYLTSTKIFGMIYVIVLIIEFVSLLISIRTISSELVKNLKERI